MTYRVYLRAMDIAMRERMPASPIRFDAAHGTWSLGGHEIRATAMQDNVIRFQLFMLDASQTLVGSYSGRIGATPKEVAQYLVYFLETGKPWHHGLSNRGLN